MLARKSGMGYSQGIQFETSIINMEEAQELNYLDDLALDDKFRCKQNNNQLYNLLKKTILPFQKDKVLKESLYMFDTQETNQ